MVAADTVKITVLPQFLMFDLHFDAKTLPRIRENHNFTAVFDVLPSFRAKSCRGPVKIDDRPSFRAKGSR